ncbi:urease accessory protein [Jatrophihabitans sp. GAS493]|uniref:urease accessory protein UreF n=1 Tax=Jatrophihabitans sp. GAS493 TaxID=1907575 RepID=UPI000BB759D4|nr:urease accessory UreF family protein [Jatrophihabitans sp. GAS493]SOD71119.1 urease accessory protein [Jatrophihabitans sp. GAS493]
MALRSEPGPVEVSARLLLLLDSRSPAGSHSHSGGMEAAIGAGFVTDLASVQEFAAARLRTAGRVAAAFAAAACQAWLDGATPEEWLELDREFSARTPSEALRKASRSLGSGLRRLVQATVPEADLRTPWQLVGTPHQPLVLGAGCALAGGTPLMAARAAALGTCTAPASAAIRLLGFDPYAIHSITAGLSEEIELTALGALEYSAPADLPADSAPAIDLLAEVHSIEEMRLFAS